MQPLNSLVSHPHEALSSKKLQIALDKNPRQICGFVVKPGACVDTESKEDQSCLFSASEPSIALRTCLICKTFLSASNTTLNAHIDKCLSVDSGEKPISKPSKPRGKPRMKVKTMVDIYAAAKGCTLEDLDERNGTKWAVISSYSNEVVSDKNKPQVCNKRKNQSVVDEDAGGIGPVYIDAKGLKLRIISEYNEKSSDPSREHEEEDVSEKKSSKEGEGNNRSFRKRLRGKKYYKHCKGNASEILECRRGYSEECRSMERSGPSQRRIKKHLGRSICDQPSENGDSLSADPLVSRVPNHVSVGLSETVSSPLNSQNSWRSCGVSQVFGKITAERGGSTFMEVDPIPIPGPPGSFLQSPWDIGTDATEHHGNFSVITSHIQSSQDQLDLTDINSSETQTFSLHNIITNDKRPSGFRDNDQSCICQRKEEAFEDTTFGHSAPHTIQQHLSLFSKSVPAAPSNSNSVLRLMGKDLMVIKQREETSHGDSSVKQTSQFQDLSRT